MKQLLVILLNIVIIFNSFSGSSKKPEENSESWNSSMQELKVLIDELIPAVFSTPEFEKVKDSKKFKDNLEKLSKLSHSIKIQADTENSKNLPTVDPSLRFVSTLLEDNSKQAFEAYKVGQKEWARGLVKQSLGYCFTCHSTDRFGPRFDDTEEPKFFKDISEVEKADYLAATRNFDNAYSLYMNAVKNKKLATTSSVDWQRAVRNALAIAVRVKNSAKIASDVVTTAMNKEYQANPLFLSSLQEWKKGIDAWKVDQKRYIDPANEKMSYEMLQALENKAKRRKSFDADRGAEVEYLRLSASAHEFIKRYPKSKNIAEVLFILGEAYDGLRGLGGMWMLQDAYWEACIYAKPNSTTSWKCFQAYRDSLTRGFSGSRGLDLPTSLALKLHELMRIANH